VAGEDTAQVTGQETHGEDNRQDVDLNDYVPKSEHKKISADMMKWKARARELEERAISDEDREEYKRLKDEREQQERENLEKKGEFEKLKEKLAKKHADDLAQKDAKIAQLDSALANVMVTREVLAAAASKSCDPETVAQLVASSFKVVYDEDNKPSVVAIQKNGEPRYSEANPGDRATVEDVVNELLEAKPYLKAQQMQRGAGTTSQTAVRTGTGALPSVDDQSSLTPERIRELRKQKHDVVRQ